MKWLFKHYNLLLVNFLLHIGTIFTENLYLDFHDRNRDDSHAGWKKKYIL